MLQILYNNEPLDIGQNDDAELQQTSPLFGIEQSIAEYTTPITILYSDRNNRLLSHYFLELTTKTKISLPVTILENGTNSGPGILVIETSNLHRYLSSRASLTGYLLINLSNFFNEVQDRKLNTLEMGGLRSFAFTTFDVTDGSAGYWQYFQSTLDLSKDFILAPVHNPNLADYPDRLTTEFMNAVTGGNISTIVRHVYPFVKLKYVLQQIFVENGWSVDFSGIGSTDWEKLILEPFGAVGVADFEFPGVFLSVVPYANVQFRLSEFMDPNTTISNFVLQVCFRYGWAPIIDGNRRSVRFIALKNNKNFVLKDWTKYAQPEATEDYKTLPPVYSYKNSFTGNDSFNSDEDISAYNIGEPVATHFDLPTPTADYDNVAVFAENENKYYNVIFNTDTLVREWQPLRDNIYDDTVENSDTDISTELTTLASYWYLYETRAGTEYLILVPYLEQSRFDAQGIRCLFFLGTSTEKKQDGTDGAFTYPVASAINFLPGGSTPVVAWANVFKYKKGGVEYGIENFWYAPWLSAIKSGTDKTMKFNLPLHELVNFKWDDKILVENVQYLVKQINRPFPFDNTVQMILRRLTTPAADVLANPIVYIKLVKDDFATGVDLTLTLTYYIYHYDSATQSHVYVRTFSDAACTVPLDVKGLVVKYNKVRTHDGDPFSVFESFVMTGHEFDLNLASVLQLTEYDFTRTHLDGSPIDDDSQAGHYTIAYTLQPDPAYTIVP